VLAALGGAMVLTSMPASAQDAERIEITGSRIKRAASEGALPVTVISREQLDASGATTVAEFVRSSTFATAGNFRPQSGSSAQSFSGMDLRGLGAERTLVLLDGRRLPKSPLTGDSVDMNSVPMAAVERIEILTDGASAVYGSDAIGGVVNIITRKDFNGVQFTVGATRPRNEGGDRDELSALLGLSSDKGRVIAGVSHSTREIVFTRQRPWDYVRGASTYGNNVYIPGVGFQALGDCNYGAGFYTNPNNGRCVYDFNAVNADEASLTNDSIFARGEYNVNEDWSIYLNSSVSRVKSFGRYAPVPAVDGNGNVPILRADNPLNPTYGTADAQDVELYHRLAALGNRDNTVDNNVYNIGAGARGTVGGFDVEFGMAYTESKSTEIGRNYSMMSLVQSAIDSGEYRVDDPYATSEDVLNAMRYTTVRDSLWRQREVYANVSRELFSMSGGAATLLLGAERRTEIYSDLYDSQSEAGNVLGASGNSAKGDRDVTSLLGEFFVPVAKNLDFSLAARYEKYSDYGSDFSPKVSARYAPTRDLTLRASFGRGFRAPSLPALHTSNAYSADSVVDYATCMEMGSGEGPLCRTVEEVQVDAFRTANPDLKSEKSKQYSFGLVFDATEWLSLKTDYWHTKIDDAISFISAQDIVDRDVGDSSLPIPSGLGLTRDPVTGAITSVTTGYRNDGTLTASGLDLNFVTNFKFGEFGRLRNDLSISRVFDWKKNGTQEVGTQGIPKFRATLSNMWNKGPWEVSWNINLIGKNGSVRNVYDPDTGEVVVDPDTGEEVVINDRTGTYVTHDVQVAWSTPIKGSRLAVGMLNVTDKLPTLVDYDGRNFNFYLYDAYGRQPYVRYTQSF
jgi:iron complex outermembrane receptor protein